MSYFWKNAEMKKFLYLLMVLAVLPSCEKDDICDPNTPTTPRLIITFYDVNNPADLKNVNQLLVTGEGMSEPYATFTGVSEVQLPLRTTEDVTQYRLTLNSNDENNDNTDVLQFNYSRNSVYVSRACGYKTLFTLDPTAPAVLTDNPEPDALWINSIGIEQPEINNEDETHIAIYY